MIFGDVSDGRLIGWRLRNPAFGAVIPICQVIFAAALSISSVRILACLVDKVEFHAARESNQIASNVSVLLFEYERRKCR